MSWFAGLVFAMAVAPTALAEKLSDNEKLAVGTWYGEFSPGAGKPLQRFLNTRLADGSYTLHARLYENGKVISELRNQGLWGISNGLYFTITTEIGTQRTDFRNAEVTNPYLVRSLTQDVFEYQHIPSGNRFRVTRVDGATARLPD